jgi:hypothetical protein
MIDATQAREISKTNFKALESDLELHNEYFKYISNMVEDAARKSQTSAIITYREDPRFTDIMSVLKWKGFKIKHYRCTNWNTIYYQDPEYQELTYEPSAGGIESTGLTLGGYFSLEW